MLLKRLATVALAATILAATCALILIGLPPYSVGANDKSDRLDYYPFNTKSLLVKPVNAATAVASTARITWDKRYLVSYTGTTSQTVTVTGMLSTDQVNVTCNTKPTNASYMTSAVPATGQFVIWWNTNPGNTLSLSVIITRIAS